MIEKKEIWTTSDGKEFSTKAEAEFHEKEIKDPQYKIEQRINLIEKKLADLEIKVSNYQINPYDIKKPASPFDQKAWYGVGDTLKEALNNLKEVK